MQHFLGTLDYIAQGFTVILLFKHSNGLAQDIYKVRYTELEQIEPILSFQFPAEGLELVIILHVNIPL